MRRRHTAVTGAVLGAVVLGGMVGTAPTAAAVGSKACKRWVSWHSRADVTYHLRVAPDQDSRSRGLVYKGTRFYSPCHAGVWSYIKVKSGHLKGKKGWIAGL
ncbi:SH3 domain-containing protein [Streptomyces smyrnaeus]|uniref:SH3 domain-containing protein n=1 Tax=Streptomyces smyrnaeus TaxID=1387713 RepID=A0ABS3Y507_9ACTN|nr:SH3 domain-containing protein [Streptomyces smyrnaeus]MBO8202705.1 SH3 domain-containing protein [Streptomyces smyrnaeus]